MEKPWKRCISERWLVTPDSLVVCFANNETPSEYMRWNLVKHGHELRVADWPYSTREENGMPASLPP
jgi:hypothetical protein